MARAAQEPLPGIHINERVARGVGVVSMLVHLPRQVADRQATLGDGGYVAAEGGPLAHIRSGVRLVTWPAASKEFIDLASDRRRVVAVWLLACS